ncbi:1,4-alpha-glucan branching protein GlgB [Ruminococcus sp. Marseille-P6503]|uniref:1,4-alpha-glucan branching protein GlgB n=1 Tax=Ruminococcus sp. Marseille-P6503 TaxID=2364796 RepID=UPI000F54C291|nr:1,4-alpha-glucan branching protein GlgB [Ruminococcus sp. Marseille-P6503]
MNMHDFYMGKVFDAYNYFGAHKENGKMVFRTFAPAASKAAVIGEFNGWTEEFMTKNGDVFELCSDEADYNQMYKYVIYSSNGERREHCDPYGFGMELRPAFASITRNLDEYSFTDDKWLASRGKNYDLPMSIYEVHLGSWKTDPDNENGWYTYDKIADKLIEYALENHFTHIEFLPLSEHPADCSWGYQNTGFFAPTSRYGTAAQLMELVDKCHNAGIGVIMDFVPVHFALDGYALAKYDGTCLYEYPSSDVSVSEWGTCNFIHSRREVCCFIQSAADYWLEKYHFDGLRMDAISRAIYWQGDPARGVNGNTVDFLKTMNSGLRRRHPSAMLIAEDSTSFPKITAPTEYGGLGFDYKWDLGFMNDTLDYFRTPPAQRPQCYHKLTFSMAYFYNELYILPFSHDENVHGKAAVIQKMWGDYEDKFRQARAFYMYVFTHPGKKLNFMGGEIAQFREWDEAREQDWDLLKYPLHDSFRKYMIKLGDLYTSRPSLYDGEYNAASFRWLIANGEKQCVYAYERICKEETTVCCFNFSDIPQKISLCFDNPCSLSELLNSDWDIYSGESRTPERISTLTSSQTSGKYTVSLNLPPFSGRIFSKAFQRTDSGRNPAKAQTAK